jgi:hypothetical protein
LQIQILSITPQTQTKNGKTSSYLDIAYKNLTFQGKVEGKKLFGFGGNTSSYKVLQGAKPGEVYDISVTKNDAGYNDWTAATLSTGGASTATPVTGGSINSQKATPSPKSTYETPEERALRQIYIVRQSSLSTAANILTTGVKSPPSPDSVIDLAKEFENYVFGKSNSTAFDATTAFDTLEDKDDFPDVPL